MEEYGRGRGRGGFRGGFRGGRGRGGGRGDDVTTTKLFVGNLPETISVSALRKEFEAFGKVMECDIVKDYAFVHFDQRTDAQAAETGMNGKDINGSEIRVELSHSKVRRKPGMGEHPGCYRCGSEKHWSKDCPSAPPGRRRHDDNLLREDPYDRRRDYLPPRYDPYSPYARERLRERYLPPAYDRYSPYDRLDPYRRRLYAEPAPLPPVSRASYPAVTVSDDPYDRPPPDYYERRKAVAAVSAVSAFRDPYVRDPY